MTTDNQWTKEDTAVLAATIHHLPPEIRPSPEFLRDTRKMLLAQIMPASLTLHRRAKTAGRKAAGEERRPSVA